MSIDRSALDEAIAAMAVITSDLHKDYIFYLHLLAQCRITFDENLKAAAGVAFHNDHYTLYLNPKEVVYEGLDSKGNHIKVLGFCKQMPIQERVGIIKHEMLHVILRHVERKDDRNHNKFNIAADCALDQEIPKEHLPSYAIYPDRNFPSKNQPPFGLTAEEYYDLIDDDELSDKGKKDNDKMPGQPDGGEEGTGEPSSDGINHDTWLESEGDPDLQRELTKRMTEKAATETQKSAGRLPNNYASIIENLTNTREVCWKQVLRRVVGNKKVNTRKTLMRRDRRLPKANWIKGKTKDRVFDLAVISDVSGSVDEDAQQLLWGSIVDICKTFDTPVTMVQVDTQPSKPEVLTKSTKVIQRKANGGTVLAPALDMLKKHKIHYDALVVTTDNYLWEKDIQPFLELNVPVIWLVQPGGRDPFPEQLERNHRYIRLKNWGE